MPKPIPKPFFSMKHDFVDSLDAYAQASLNLWQAVDILLNLYGDGALGDQTFKVLKERADAWKESAFETERAG